MNPGSNEKASLYRLSGKFGGLDINGRRRLPADSVLVY